MDRGYECESQEAKGDPVAPASSEVVLVVEDEAAIRRLVRIVLENMGYTVLDAADGSEGLALCGAHEGPIDLLLTDVLLPKLGGCELVEAAVPLRPGLRVLFMSGYTNWEVVPERLAQDAAGFLQKPFTLEALRREVRRALDLGEDFGARGGIEYRLGIDAM